MAQLVLDFLVSYASEQNTFHDPPFPAKQMVRKHRQGGKIAQVSLLSS
jgi:hypothetical protein